MKLLESSNVAERLEKDETSCFILNFVYSRCIIGASLVVVDYQSDWAEVHRGSLEANTLNGLVTRELATWTLCLIFDTESIQRRNR